MRVTLCGDSISAGYNASKFTGAEPGCPAYGELVALSLQKHFGSEVTLTNHAVSALVHRILRQGVDGPNTLV